MILGLPCIATYVGGIPSLITSRKNGFLVSDSDSFELAATINTVYKDKLLLEAISQEAQSDARYRHDRIRILKQLTDTYQKIIKDFSDQQ